MGSGLGSNRERETNEHKRQLANGSFSNTRMHYVCWVGDVLTLVREHFGNKEKDDKTGWTPGLGLICRLCLSDWCEEGGKVVGK